MSANDPGAGYSERVAAGGLDKVAEAARFLSLSVSTLYDLMARGELAYVKLGRSRRVPHQAVIELAARGLAGGSNSNAEEQ
jgi:excisionase family DNA binding protein